MAGLSLSSIRFQPDLLITKTTGIISLNQGAGFQLTEATQCTGFSISASEPSGTAIHYAFNTDGYWFSLDPNGLAQNFASGEIEYSDIEDYGNTTTELRGLTAIPAFVGKSVRVAIGLETDDIQTARPTLTSIAVNWRNSSQMLQTTLLSPVYELGENSQCAACTVDTLIQDNADLTITAQITKSNGIQSDWLPVNQLSGQTAEKIQFKGVYSVADIDSGSAKIRRLDFVYSDGTYTMAGQNNADLFSPTQELYRNVNQCRLTVKHSQITASSITAHICIRQAPVLIQGEVLGVGTDGRRTFQLQHTNGIKYDTVRLYFDGVRIYTGFEVNTEAGRITCTPGEGVNVSCDYEYGWTAETWQEMTLTSSIDMPDYVQSEYRYAYDGSGNTVCALKMCLHMTEGSTEGETVATAIGSLQTAKLQHYVNDGAITLYADGVELNASQYEILDDPQYIRFTAPVNAVITANYDWVSEIPVIYKFAAVFAE